MFIQLFAKPQAYKSNRNMPGIVYFICFSSCFFAKLQAYKSGIQYLELSRGVLFSSSSYFLKSSLDKWNF